MEVNKVCTKCKMQKSLTEFHNDKTKKSGYRNNCKICQNMEAKERAQKILKTRD